MQQYYAAILALFVLTRLDRTNDTSNHALHFSVKIDVNGPILMKLWLGEVRCCDGEFRCKTSPSHNFINITILSPYHAYKCR